MVFYEGRCVCGKTLYWRVVEEEKLSIEKNFEFCPACLGKVCFDCVDSHLRTHGIGGLNVQE